MSVKIMSWVWEHSRSTGTDRLVLLALADRADEHGICWPSVSTIAAKTRVSTATVKRSLRSLQDIGELRSEERPGTSNRYSICTVAQSDLGQSDPGQSDTQVNGDPGRGVNLYPGGRSPVTPDTSLIHHLNHHSSSTDRFDEFWSIYPKKVSKKTARLRWTSAMKRKVDPQTIIDGATRYASSVRGKDPQHIKNPDGWINGEKWADEITPSPSGEVWDRGMWA